MLVLLLALVGVAESALIAVQTVSRHGTRAPDAFFKDLCPNAAATMDWGVDWSQLTGIGMAQLHQLGDLMRKIYVTDSGWLPAQFTVESMVMRTQMHPRCQQSGMSFGHGLYPPSTAPSGYDFSSPLPYSFVDEDDNLLSCRKWGCKATTKAWNKAWQKTRGADLLTEHQGLIENVGKACGVDLFEFKGEDTFEAIKDVNDGFLMAVESGFPPLVDKATLAALNQFAAYMLTSKQYDTPDKITAYVGDMPATLLDNYHQILAGKAPKMFNYHAHRHIVYSMGEVYGIDFNTTNGTYGSAPPATTIFFEFHNDHVTPSWETTVVRAFVWTRCNSLGPCPRHPVHLRRCDGRHHCPLPQFQAIWDDLVNKTGTWQSICAKAD